MKPNDTMLSYRWWGAIFRNIDNVFHKFKLVITRPPVIDFSDWLG